MSLFDKHPWFYFWNRFFNKPKSVSSGDEVLEINIYQTKSLTDEYSRNPEITVQNYIAEIFDGLNIGYKISRNFSTYTPPVEESNPDTDVLRWWARQNRTSEAEDANILLMNIDGGGRAFIGGKISLAPAGNIWKIESFSEEGKSDLHRNIRACLHELGHSLGARHSDEYQVDPPSMLYSESGIEVIREYIEQKR